MANPRPLFPDDSLLRARGRRNRRTLLGAGLSAAGALAIPARAFAAPSANLNAPALQAQSVYFADTGHVVAGAFWTLWRAYGLDAFGYPISEAFDDGGVLNQYFQRVRFEQAPDGTVRLGLLGIEAGGTEAAPAGDPVAPADPAALTVEETGQTVAGAFATAYRRWQAVLGPPIGQEHAVGDGYYQYFAHARLEWDPVAGVVRLGLLGSETASRRGVDTGPVTAPAGMTTWADVVAALVADEQERIALGAKVSNGKGFVPSYGEKWIAVSIAQQRITAYEHTTSVFTDLVSTGDTAKGLTPQGIFAINRRVANEMMDSTSIGIPKSDPKYYRLENVLYTQYFDNTGAAIHYAWWHNNFGHPMSYGCVNLRLSAAKWFWEWAQVGTRIVVV